MFSLSKLITMKLNDVGIKMRIALVITLIGLVIAFANMTYTLYSLGNQYKHLDPTLEKTNE